MIDIELVIGHLHTGDLIALGSKSGGSKSSLRTSDRDDLKSSKATSGSPSVSNIPPAKKFKGSSISETSGGGLFSDPLRVGQNQSSSSKTGSGAIKASHSLQRDSPTQSGGSTPPAIEGSYSIETCLCGHLYTKTISILHSFN